MASQQEATIKRHFEGHILSLKNDLKRVQNDCKNFTQKIGDKNNQVIRILGLTYSGFGCAFFYI